MLLQIEHDTYYRFEAPQRYTIQTLRFTPKNDPVQQIMRWGIRANSNGFMPQFEDSFGNITHTLALDRPRQSLGFRVTDMLLPACDDAGHKASPGGTPAPFIKIQ